MGLGLLIGRTQEATPAVSLPEALLFPALSQNWSNTAMTKKEALEKPDLITMFEEVLQDGGPFQDSDDWRECKYAYHASWLEPLLTMGALTETGQHQAWPDDAERGDRPQFNYHKYAVTPKGMAWWIGEYTKQVPDRHAALASLIEPRGFSPAQLDGKGIGAGLTYNHGHGELKAAMVGIEEDYFEFASWYYYYRDFMGARLGVRLTAKGMHFFDSLPRLQLECA